MHTFFYLSTCATCQRIMKALDLSSVQLQDIKFDPVKAIQLKKMRDLAGSYEALFSRRAQKYRQMGLHEKSLQEEDYRDLILQEYTFLKRPVLVLGSDLAAAGLASGTPEWAVGIGGEDWRCVHTVQRVPGATAARL